MRKGKGAILCPFSFGMALGLTYGLSVFIMAILIMQGMAPINPALITEPMTWFASGMQFLWGFIEGFVFGFVLALLYDLIACCMFKCFGKKSEGNGCGCECKCGCGCCSNKK